MSRHPDRLPAREWEVLRRAVFTRDRWRCRKCGKAGRLECDHVVRLEDGGTNDMSNLQSLCAFPCHAEKTRLENEKPDPRRDAWRALVAKMRA